MNKFEALAVTPQPTEDMLAVFDQLRQRSEADANRRLLEWLSNDATRDQLYARLGAAHRPLQFQSPADTREWAYDSADPNYRQTVYLLAEKAQVAHALHASAEYSNSPFHALGGGNFMLGLDPAMPPRDDDPHAVQRAFAESQLKVDEAELLGLVTVAFQAGAVLGLKQRKFDLADIAAEVAVRYMGFMFGFAQSDHALIDQTMRKAYRGLCYQVMGRHFVSEPGTMPEANANMGALLRRAAELIGIYQAEAGNAHLAGVRCTRCGRLGHSDGIGCAQADETRLLAKELQELRTFAMPGKPQSTPLENFNPLLRRMALRTGATFTNTEAAVLVVGMIAGAIGNIQASICIAVRHFFQLADGKQLASVIELAQKARQTSRGAAADADFAPCVSEALRRNPPVAFLPRKTRVAMTVGGVDIPKDSVVLLGIGGATRRVGDDGGYGLPAPSSAAGCPFGHGPAAVFGGGDDGRIYPHACIGEQVSMPLVVHVVRQIMVLPGLAEACDLRTGRASGLRKLWGYGCESYPMEFRREDLLVQSPLSVIMKIKSPTAEHAEKLKLVIRWGAPSIEKKLKDARHVHFASFQFLENDTKLALFTVFDRDFDSYIAHFALEIGPLFDKIFEHIVDAPPLPVDEFPREFVDTIRRYNVPPAAGYFFSAYPNADAAQLGAEHEKAFP
ncbi:MAG: Cytochrome [Rhodoferax sp.]|nr:Cytochrome [Rhodoferax sp.]